MGFENIKPIEKVSETVNEKFLVARERRDEYREKWGDNATLLGRIVEIMRDKRPDEAAAMAYEENKEHIIAEAEMLQECYQKYTEVLQTLAEKYGIEQSKPREINDFIRDMPDFGSVLESADTYQKHMTTDDYVTWHVEKIAHSDLFTRPLDEDEQVEIENQKYLIGDEMVGKRVLRRDFGMDYEAAKEAALRNGSKRVVKLIETFVKKSGRYEEVVVRSEKYLPKPNDAIFLGLGHKMNFKVKTASSLDVPPDLTYHFDIILDNNIEELDKERNPIKVSVETLKGNLQFEGTDAAELYQNICDRIVGHGYSGSVVISNLKGATLKMANGEVVSIMDLTPEHLEAMRPKVEEVQ